MLKKAPNLLILITFAGVILYIGPTRIIDQWRQILGLDAAHPTMPPAQPQPTKPDQQETLVAGSNQTQARLPLRALPHVQSGNSEKDTVQRRAQPRPAKKIYRWRTPDGKIHFSDSLPEDPNIEVLDRSEQYAFEKSYQVDVIGADFKLPPDTQSKLDVAVSKIFEIYQQALTLDHKNDPYIKIKVFGNRGNFERYKQKVAPKLETATGFYNTQRNEAALWQHHGLEALLAVATHESSHAILSYKAPSSPTWLNEGLAEYFETMQVFGQAVVIHPNPVWEQWLTKHRRNADFPELASFLPMNHDQWLRFNGQDNRSYALSLSLVYYFMSSNEGRHLVSNLIKTCQSIPCHHLDSARFIDQHYFGGLERLEKEWLAWLPANKSPHRY